MKYCVIDLETNQRVSRFFKTKRQAENRLIRPNLKVISNKTAIESGIFIPSKDRKVVREYVPIQMIKGRYFSPDSYSNAFANKHNQQLYVEGCIRLGTTIPI